MLALPVHRRSVGKAGPIIADPMLPAIFIVPETWPACLPPISMQNDHEGLSTMSTPKTASDSQKIAGPTEDCWTLIIIPIVVRQKPKIAGSLRERACRRVA